jgi:UDP-N-acetyl-D-glucosamine/UDP-N-acetyl-D-galactosamine dehydrogenase
VLTPIDKQKQPDLGPLESACQIAGKTISRGNVVVFESPVYPASTEEMCAPIIDAESSLKYNKDFLLAVVQSALL